MPDGPVIILAFGMDDIGGLLVNELRALAPAQCKVRQMPLEPGTGKDWNKGLKHRHGLTQRGFKHTFVLLMVS
ncbi:MAG: hypothetical protein PHY92_01635 [Alphaproteobacteria bacterium]|nr:hypothetical protein [Alphaproteobacteria bacterium]